MNFTGHRQAEFPLPIMCNDFNYVLSTLVLAKELHNMDRTDILANFCDSIDWDSFYVNIRAIHEDLFDSFCESYDECENNYTLVFEDSMFANYFTRAHLLKSINPEESWQMIEKAEGAAREHLICNMCVEVKILGYTNSIKNARKSKLVVKQYSCGGGECGAEESIAFGLLKLHQWFQSQTLGWAENPWQMSLDEVGWGEK